MKKVIYCLGTIALVAGLVDDANGLNTFPAGGRMVRQAKRITKSFDPVTRETVVTNQSTGLTHVEKDIEGLREKKAMADGEVAVLRLQNDRLEKQVVALQKTQQAQQELLEGYGKELKHIATFCDQVQAFIK